MKTLTGRIRHRTHIGMAYRSAPPQYLVLQVEDAEPNGTPFWRDARTEDLTTITLNSLTEVKQQ